MENPIETLISDQKRAVESGDPMKYFGVLATIDENQAPQTRVVNVRKFDQQGLIIVTSENSPKVLQLKTSHKYSLTFYWESLSIQYRVRGDYKILKDDDLRPFWHQKAESSKLMDIYHHQIRHQSSEVSSRDTIINEANQLKQSLKNQFEQPQSLCGVQFVPTEIEQWIQSDDRIHQRFLYRNQSNGWNKTILVP